MKKKLLNFLLLFTLFISFANSAKAGAGLYDASIQVQGNPYTETYLRTNTPAFGNVTTLTLDAVKGFVWKDGSGNICNVFLYYRMYPQGSSPSGSFTQVATIYNSPQGGNNYLWMVSPATNLLSGLSLGTNYTMEFYFQATGSSSTTDQCGDNYFLSNLNTNYHINFSYGNIYYSQNTGVINGNTNWKSTRSGGGGSTPGATPSANDVYIIQSGHLMTTNADWGTGVSNTKIEIENGGKLTSTNLITTTYFQVDNGGSYIHNYVSAATNGNTTDFPGTTQTFGATSSVEIQSWAGGGTTPVALPTITSPGWGNLKINVASLGGTWQQNGTLTNVQGLLEIAATGGSTNEFVLTKTTTYTSTFGSLTVSGGSLNPANGNGATSTINVTSNLSVTGGTFNGPTASTTYSLNVGGAANFSGGNFYFSVKSGNAVNIAVNGNFNISGTANLDVKSTGIFNYQLSIGGNLNASAGTFTMVGGSGNTGAKFIVTGDVNISGASLIHKGGATTTFNIGGKLNITAGTFNINSSSATINTTIGTDLLLSGTGNISNSGNATFTTVGKVDISNSATFLGASGLSISTFNIGTNLNIAGSGDINSTGSLIFTVPGNVNITTGSNSLGIRGTSNLKFSMTCSGDLNLNGAYIMQGSNTYPGGPFDLFLGGNFNMTGGLLTGGSKTIIGTITFKNGLGISNPTYTQSGGTVSGANFPIAFVVENAKTLTLNNDIVLYNGTSLYGSFTVNSGATLIACSNKITGAGNFAMQGPASSSITGATIQIGDAAGITSIPTTSGTIQCINSRTFPTTANYVYCGNAANAVTGNGLPTTVHNLTVNNSNAAGVVALTSNVTIANDGYSDGVLNLTAGTLDINAKTITMGNTSANLINVTGARLVINSNATGGLIDIPSTSSKLSIVSVSGTSLNLGTKVELRTAKEVDFLTNFTTVKDTFRLKPNGFCSNPPYYSTTSTLIYDCLCNYTSNNSVNKEWYENTYGTAAGVPNDVWIKAGSSLNFAASGTPHEMQGSMIIGEASGSPSTLILSTGNHGDLNVGGNWTRNNQGLFTHNNREVVFNGSNNATLTVNNTVPALQYEQFAYLRLKKNAVGNKLTMASEIRVEQRVAFEVGTLDLGTNNKNFTLLSTAAATARVDQIATPGNIGFTYGTGNLGQFIAQRYVAAKRAWRLLSPPFKTGTAFHFISQAWQEGQAFDYSSASATTASLSSDTVAVGAGGFATQITGGPIANGFDLSPTNKPSIFKFTPSNTSSIATAGSWASNPVANTNATDINSQRGWMLFVRGDRRNFGQITNQYKSPTITTLRPRGQLNIGSVTIPSSGILTGIQVVGNPYASAVDYSAVTKTGSVTTNIWEWDPNGGGALGLGTFVTKSSSSYTLPSGAAIMVDFGTPGGTITFNETNKTSSSTTPAYRPARSITTTLTATEADSTTRFMVDGTLNLFDSKYDTAVTTDDAVKLQNIEGENFSIKHNGVLLSIDKTKLPQQTDTIFYNWSKVKIKDYQLQITTDSLQDAWVNLVLDDNYKHTQMPINLGDTNKYDFKIVQQDSGTFRADRLKLIMKYNPPKIAAINADQVYSDIAVNWTLENERYVAQYEIEKSTDGINFTKVGEVASIHNWLDNAPQVGNNIYRIKGVGTSGNTFYSSSATIKLDKPELTVIHNPIQNGVVDLQLTNMPKGQYGIQITNSLGQTVNTKSINHLGGSNTEKIPVNNTKGIYNVKIVKPNKTKETIKVVY